MYGSAWVKIEPNWNKLFVKFKIAESNWTVCILNQIKLFQIESSCFEPNCYYLYRWKKTKKKTNEIEFYNFLKPIWTIPNRTKLLRIKPNCFSSVQELLEMVQFFWFGLVQQFHSVLLSTHNWEIVINNLVYKRK